MPNTSNKYSSGVPPRGLAIPQNTTSHYGPPRPGERIWEDLLEDEKIERLMKVTTQLWIRTQMLEKENRQLRRHKHNENGHPIIEQEINGGDMSYDPEPQINYNPFDSKEVEESAVPGY